MYKLTLYNSIMMGFRKNDSVSFANPNAATLANIITCSC